MVPLLLIRMKVMIAIRISATFAPANWSANPSLGLGHGTVVDMRTVMYDTRKQLKMKVSLSRKIHIMAFPQDALLNARWSEAQSAATSSQPCFAATTGSAVALAAVKAAWSMLGSALM